MVELTTDGLGIIFREIFIYLFNLSIFSMVKKMNDLFNVSLSLVREIFIFLFFFFFFFSFRQDERVYKKTVYT